MDSKLAPLSPTATPRWSDVRHFNMFVNFKGQGEFWVIQGSTEEEGTLIAINEVSSPRPVNDTSGYYFPNNDFQAEPIQIDNILIECNVAAFEPTRNFPLFHKRLRESNKKNL